MKKLVIGIIGAMQEEISLLLNVMTHTNKITKAGIDYFQGELNDKNIVVCKSGVGKVNSAVCTQILIDTFKIDQLIFTGVAGALHPELNIGDLVISSESMYHDMNAVALGFKWGEIPYQETYIFKSDQKLIDLAYQTSLNLFENKILIGRVLSGDQFIADKSQVQKLYEDLGGFCTEMEGASVAHVCFMNEIPHVIIRSMSDKADGSAHINFNEFVHIASEQAFKLVSNMILSL